MKLLKKRSLPECSKRSRGFIRNKRPSPEGRQWLSGLKQEDSTMIGKEQD
jgi:hypothetical protein